MVIHTEKDIHMAANSPREEIIWPSNFFDDDKVAHALLNFIPDAVLIVNDEGRIIFINDSAETLFGYKKSQLEGELIETIIPERFRKKHVRLRDDYFHHPVTRPMGRDIDLYGITKAGKEFILDICLSPITTKKEDLVVCFARDITEKKMAFDKLHNLNLALEKLANYDPLTKLSNRKNFNDILAREVSRCDRQGLKLAMLYIDLDNFKPVNDAYGHHIGDNVLQDIAILLKKDTRHEDYVARLGGDEFSIVITDITHKNDAAIVATKILKNLCKEYKIDGIKHKISASIGISFYPDDGRDIQAVIRKADEAMYAAKLAGGNQYKIYEETSKP